MDTSEAVKGPRAGDGGSPAVSRAIGRADLAWGALIVAACLLPVGSTAAFLTGAHSATDADLRAGVAILKLSLIALSIAGIAASRLPARTVLQDSLVRSRLTTTTLVVLGAVLVLATAVRAYRIDTELWLDEILLLTRYVPLEIRQLISTFDSQNHQPLYSLLARLSFLATGGAEWSIRLPAAAFGVASLIALFAFGRRVASTAEATLAALLLAVSYHHVWFSQNARGYTLMLFLAILGTRFFIDLCEAKGHPYRVAWAYGIVMSLATYTHMTAALIAFGHALAMVLTTRWTSAEGRKRTTWPVVALALSAILAVTLYAPMLPQVWRQIGTPTMDGVAVEWTGAGWMLGEGLRVLSEGVPGGLFTVVVAFIVLGVGVASYWRQSRITTLAMFLPIAVTFTAIIAARHNLWPRFFFFASGFLVLTALRGGFVLVRTFVRWQPDRVAIAGASAVALLSLLTIPRAWQPKQQFHAALDFVEGERQPGDAVVALDIVADVYRLRGWAPDWRTVRDVGALAALERSAPRTWIVYTLPAKVRAQAPELYEHVTGAGYHLIRLFPATVGAGEIHVLRHDSTTAHD
jgi:4-amino-4-deoxy-L-arabinose transferase-like glycosyltransferase